MAWRVLSEKLNIGGVESQCSQVDWNSSECETRAHHNGTGPSISSALYSSLSSGSGALAELNGDIYPVDQEYEFPNNFSIFKRVIVDSMSISCYHSETYLSGQTMGASAWRIRRWHGKCVILVNDDSEEAVVWFGLYEDTAATGTSSGGNGFFTNNQAHNFWLTLQGIIIPEYSLKSLRSINGTDRTLWLTQANNNLTWSDGFYHFLTSETGNYLSAIDDRARYQRLFSETDRVIMTVLETEEQKWTLEQYDTHPQGDAIQTTIRCRKTVNGATTTLFDAGNYLVIDDRNRQLMIFEDAENEVAFLAYFQPNGTVVGESDIEIDTSFSEVFAHSFYLFIHGASVPGDPNDPYANIPDTPGHGGDGSYDLTSDPNPDTPLPPNMVTDVGFCTVFVPSNTDMKNLASYMWTNALFDVDTFKKLFANPMDCMMGFSILPVHASSNSYAALNVGNISTGLNFPVLAKEYDDVDMGSTKIEKVYNGFLDYSPYSQLSVYLPYCGVHTLDNDKYMGKTVNIKYRVHFVTGACVVKLIVDGDVYDQFAGNMNVQLPITGNSYNQMISSLVGIVGGVTRGVTSVMSNSVGGMMSALGSTAQNVAGLKPTLQQSGSLGSNVGACTELRPYFIQHVKKMVKNIQNQLVGTPTLLTQKLSNKTGYVKVHEIHIASDVATQGELERIEALLKGGVIIEDQIIPE